MDNPKPSETKGVPWGDHNETESTPPDTRREEYGDAEPGENADERAADHSTDSDERDGASQEQQPDQSSDRSVQEPQKPIYDL